MTGGYVDDAFTHSFILNTTYDMLIAVDRGLMFFERKNLSPHYIVGDFDSVSKEVLDKYRNMGGNEVKSFCPEKDETDTELAILLALNKGCKTLYLLGATGSRLDHMLGNIQLLGFGLRNKAECYLIDPNNKLRLIDGRTVIKREEQFGDYISLIPYTPVVKGITLTGLKYPLNDYTMSGFYLEGAKTISGVSNEMIDDEAVIELKEGILVLIEAKE